MKFPNGEDGLREKATGYWREAALHLLYFSQSVCFRDCFQVIVSAPVGDFLLGCEGGLFFCSVYFCVCFGMQASRIAPLVLLDSDE